MNAKIEQVIASLDVLEKARQNAEISGFAAGMEREKLLISGLNALAAACGVMLRNPMRIDANGEISIVAKRPDDTLDVNACAEYGAKFAAMLSPFSPRTGTVAMSRVDPRNGWCRMNHFDVERMLRAALLDATNACDLLAACKALLESSAPNARRTLAKEGRLAMHGAVLYAIDAIDRAEGGAK